MGTSHRITERVAAPFTGCVVDRAAGVIRGMLVCGHESENGRDYPWGKGLTHRQGTYEGRFVNCDHGGQQSTTVDRRLGWLAGETTDAQGRPRADLHVLKSHPMADRVFEAAERNPALFGLSHVALCKTRRGPNGRDVVESVDEVETVDLVAEPATTKGFFESRNKGGRVVTIKFRESLARLRPAVEAKDPARGKLLRKFLLEAEDDMGMAPVLDAPVDEPTDGADPDDQLLQGFKSAIDAVWQQYTDDKDAGAAIKAISKYIKAHAKLTSGADTPDDKSDVPADDAAAEESKKRPKGLAGLITEAKSFGLKDPTTSQLAVLEVIPTTAGRRAYCDEASTRRVTEAEKPTSTGRHQTDRFAEEREAVTRVNESRSGKAQEPTANDMYAWKD